MPDYSKDQRIPLALRQFIPSPGSPVHRFGKNIVENPAVAAGGGLLGAVFPLIAAVLANRLHVKAPKLYPPSYTGKDPIRIGRLLKEQFASGMYPSPRSQALQQQITGGAGLGIALAPQFKKRGALGEICSS